MSDLGAKLETLVNKLVDDASKDGTTMTQRLEIFKLASDYYVKKERLNGGGKRDNEPPQAGSTMDGFRQSVSSSATAPGPEQEDEQDE